MATSIPGAQNTSGSSAPTINLLAWDIQSGGFESYGAAAVYQVREAAINTALQTNRQHLDIKGQTTVLFISAVR